MIFGNNQNYIFRNINVEAIDIEPHPSSENWRQQSFGTESQDSNKAKKSSFDSGVI